MVTDGMEEVGLPQPRLAVDEERVVVTPGLLGHGERRHVGELVRLPDDEVVERVLGDEPGLEVLHRCGELALDGLAGGCPGGVGHRLVGVRPGRGDGGRELDRRLVTEDGDRRLGDGR